MSDEAWKDQALCKGATSFFFPERGKPVIDIKAVCAKCPVRIECLELALKTNEGHGFFGGMSVRERRKLRAQRKREARMPEETPHCHDSATS